MSSFESIDSHVQSGEFPLPQRPLQDAEGVLNLQTTHLEHGRVNIGSESIRWTLEIPEQLSYDGLAVFIPGYLGIKQSSRRPRQALAQEGIATLSFSPARTGLESIKDTITNPQNLHVQTQIALASDLRRRRRQISKDVPNGNNIDFDKKLLVAHSMGGLTAPKYALEESNAVHAITGLATAGLGHPKPLEIGEDIVKGAAAAVKHELLPALRSGAIELSLSNIRDITKYYMRLRVLFEGLSCIKDTVKDEVAALRDRSIPYSYIAFERDILVRAHPDVAQFVTSHCVIPNYGHLAPQAKSNHVANQIATDLKSVAA